MLSDEESKAIQETGKAIGKSLDLLKGAGGVFKQVIGNSLDEFGGIATDWAKYQRFKNLCSIADKLDRLIASRKAVGKLTPLPPAFALPLLDGASLECEDEVQEMWAALIANAADPAKCLVLRKVYIEILRGLQPIDARLLKALSRGPVLQKFLQDLAARDSNANFNSRVVAELLQVPLEDAQISLQTLGRYGCLLDSWAVTYKGFDEACAGFRVENPGSNFRISDLGQRLVAATSAESV